MSFHGQKVVVTGADGFIGSHVVEALVTQGAQVTALALYNAVDNHGWLDDLAPSMLQDIHLARGDVRDPAFVQRLLKGQDICLHLAALIAIPYSYAAPQSYVSSNIIGTLNVLEAARNADLTRVVHTSTSEVYGTALTTPMNETHPLQGQSPYSATKIGADMMAQAFARSFQLPVVTLRPFNTFGPRQSERAVISSTIRQALDPQCPTIRMGDLTTERDFTYVEDTAAAFLALARAPDVEFGSAYNGGTGRAVTIGEVAGIIQRASQTNKEIEVEQARLRPADSEVRTLLADNSRIHAACGWSPVHSLEAGIERTVAWWRQRLEAGRVREDSRYVV